MSKAWDAKRRWSFSSRANGWGMGRWCLKLAVVLLLAHQVTAAPLPERIELPGPFPYGLACAPHQLWCVDFETSDLYCIALPAGPVRRVARLPLESPSGLCFVRSKLFVAAQSAIHQVDPRTGRCGPSVPLEMPAPTGLASDGRHFYVADRQLHVIAVIDASNGKRLRSFPVPGQSPRGMTWHDGSLWLVDSSDRAVYRLDPADGRIQAAFVSPAGEPRGVECAGGLWWFTMRNGHCLQPTRVEQLGPEVPGNAMRSNPLRVQVHYTHMVENRSPKPIEDVVFCLAVPPETPRQQIESLDFEPAPDEIRRDRFGQKIAVFRFPKLQAEQKAEVGWTVKARLWAIRYTPDVSRLGAVSDAPPDVTRLFTEDAAVLGLELPAIKQAARQAARGAQNPLELAAAIRDYVMQRVHYQRDGRWDPAAVVLERGEGSCSEYSYAFAALARANALPVRFVGATTYRPPQNPSAGQANDPPSSGRYEDRVFHRWVEVYLPPYGWLPVDANRDDRSSPPFPRRYFLALTERLLVISKTGWGDEDNLGAAYHSRHSWKPGENSRRQCRVESRRVAVWQRLPDGP